MMLARANSDTAARLRRSKSTSTVHKRPTSVAEPLDLDAIRQQALAAATTAFARAQAQDEADYANRRSSDLSRSKSNASRRSLTTQGNHFPAPGSSFRSMQAPKAEQGKDSQRKSQTSISHTEQTSQQPSRLHPTPTSGDSLPVPHQLSKQPSVALTENAKSTTQQTIVRSSVASSVTSQQIRKARSMYYASSIQTGSPIARPPAKYLTPTPSNGRSPGSETSPMQPPPRTLGQSPLIEPRIPITITPGMTLNEARDEYLHEFQQSSVKHKPSMFLAPFKKRRDKAKDRAKSVSSESQLFTVPSEDMPIEPTVDTTLSNSMPQQDLKEQRSFSGSLKHKIKRVFRRTSQKPTDLPMQHIKASRQYFDAPHLGPSSSGDPSSIPCPDEITLERVRGRTSSLEKARPAYLRSEYRSDSTGSERSARGLHSEVNAPHVPASRVTSWGTTSTGDTLTQRSINRMTVIHESKDSIGSEEERACSTTRSRRKTLPLPSLASFRDPMPSMHSLPEEELSSIDPKRVYSALMREIRTSKLSSEPSFPVKPTSGAGNGVRESSMAVVQDQDLSSSGSHNVQNNIEASQRTSSRQSSIAHSVRSKPSAIKTFGKAMRSTIRAVTPAGPHLPTYSEPTAVAKDITSTGKNYHSSPPATPPGNGDSQGGSSIAKQQHTASPHIPSASLIEKRIEKSRDRWKAHLEDPPHLPFPRETDKTYDVIAFVRQTRATPSGSTKSSKGSETHDYSVIEEDLKPALSLEAPKSRYLEMPMSPSIYSRNTDGISINVNDSVTSFDGPGQLGQFHNPISATRFTSGSVRSYVAGTMSPQCQEGTHGSHDWRAWLSHEISATKLGSHEDLTTKEAYSRFPKREWPDSMHVSRTGHEDASIVVRDCMDATASQVDINTAAAVDISFRGGNSGNSSDRMNESTRMSRASSEEHNAVHNTFNTDHVSGSSLDVTTDNQVYNTSQPKSASLSSTSRPLSTFNICTSYGADIDTPKQTPGNGQAALADISRCFSSNSLASRQSVLTANSMASLNSPKSAEPTPERTFRSSLSTRSKNEASQQTATTPLKRRGTHVRRKENQTPTSLYAHKQSTPSTLSSLPRPKSHQLLSSSTPNYSSPNIDRLNVAIPKSTSTIPPPSPTAESLRPRIRIIARPISPEKHPRRPKSALDLQATSKFESPTRLTDFTAASSPSCPKTNVRDPAQYTTLSPLSSLLLYKEPVSARPTAAAISKGGCYGRSGTPGHRMVDQFLRQRNSPIGCDERAEKRKGSKFLVREDTPAFL